MLGCVMIYTLSIHMVLSLKHVRLLFKVYTHRGDLGLVKWWCECQLCYNSTY